MTKDDLWEIMRDLVNANREFLPERIIFYADDGIENQDQKKSTSCNDSERASIPS